ncbi:MAG: cation:proton antiporter [Victivallaceae bacterium]
MLLSDPVLVFTILIMVILLAPLLAERLRVPDLVLLLLAGVALGPNGFGLLARNAAITLFGSVGMLYIMFLAGLEIDLYRFLSTRVRSISFGLLTFILPLGIGTLLGYYVLSMSLTASILLASMFASHTLLAYPIASRLGISRSEPVAVTVGATIITDTLALLVLAVIADSARGVKLGIGFWLGIGLGMVALILFTWYGISWLSRWFFKKVPEKGGAQFLFVIMMVCGCAYLSHFAKMEPIIGAFLAGATFNRLIPVRSTLMNRIVFVGNTLFIPFFLISVGMLVNVGTIIQNPQSWLVAATMVVTVLFTKYCAAQVARRIFGYNSDAGNVMFGLSVVQAAATLAAVTVGYNLHIFDETVLNGAIVMILVTCLLGAWTVDKYGRRMAARVPDKIIPARTEQRLLIAVSSPASATRLLEIGFLMRDPSLPGAICPVTIVPEDGNIEESIDRGEKLLALCMTDAAAADIPVNPGIRLSLNAADGIVRAARELRSDAVFLGWSCGRKTIIQLFGSVLDDILAECPSRLYICRLVRPINTTRRLLLLFPPLAEQRQDVVSLIEEAKYLSRQIGASLYIHLCQSSAGHLRERIKTVKPLIPASVVESSNWNEARSRLINDLRADDMVIFSVERRQSPLWTPSMERLPETVAARFPDINLLVAYPMHFFNDEPAFQESDQSCADVKPCDFYPVDGLDDAGALKDILRQMARVVSKISPVKSKSDFSFLTDCEQAFPIELSPSMLLLHFRCEEIEKATVLIGFKKASWTALYPDIKNPVQSILLLLSPRNQPPEQHLKALSNLARCINDKSIAEQISNAVDADEIATILRNYYGRIA